MHLPALIAAGRQSILDDMERGPDSPHTYEPDAIRSAPGVLADVPDTLLGCQAIAMGDCTKEHWDSLSRDEREALIEDHVEVLLAGRTPAEFARSLPVTRWRVGCKDAWGPKHANAVARIAASCPVAARLIITSNLNREGTLWRCFWKLELRRTGNVRYQLKAQREVDEALADHFQAAA